MDRLTTTQTITIIHPNEKLQIVITTSDTRAILTHSTRFTLHGIQYLPDKVLYYTNTTDKPATVIFKEQMLYIKYLFGISYPPQSQPYL